MFNFFKNNCYNGGNKHNYKPFYIKIKPNIPYFEGTMWAYEQMVEKDTRNIYQYHICSWCGKKIVE